MATIRTVQDTLAAKMLSEIGATVEFTFRDSDQWTISGESNDAERAMAYFAENGLGCEISRIFDEEIGELYIYLVTGQKSVPA